MNSKAKFILRKSVLKQYFETLLQHCDKISFSAKTNYVVARILAKETNCSFSIHTIDAMRSLGVPNRCWYFPQAWDKQEIAHVLTQVQGVVIDNESDLNTLLQYLTDTPSANCVLALRMRLQEHTVHTGKYFVYGMYSHQIQRHIKALRNHKQITALGIHFHRKSQNVSEWNLQYELNDLLSEETLQTITFLNMGGGIPATYKNFQGKVHERIFAEIDCLREWLGKYDIRLIAEPGRYLAAPCIELHATAQLVSEEYIVVDCSVYQAAMDTFVTHSKLLVKNELPPGNGTPYTIKGKTPDSMDIFRYRVYLERVEPGETLVFLNAGAYNYTTDFCGLKPLATEVIE